MATIYNSPEEIKVPEFNWQDLEAYRKSEEKFLENLKAFLKRRNKGKNVGEIIKFPAADGYALYMVASMRPAELVHIPLGDAWHFQYAHLLTAKEIQDKIDQEKAMEELFAKHKNK